MKQAKHSGVSTLLVKDINTKSVLHILKEAHTATVRELSAASGLSAVTVKSIISMLRAEGRAIPDGTVPSQGGRPSQCYRFNEQHALGLLLFARELHGIDTLCLRVIDLYGTVLDSTDCRMPSMEYEAVESLIAQKIGPFSRIRAVGIGLPGIEYEGSMVSLDYEALVGTPIIERLHSRFRIPILVENDVNAAVLGRSEGEHQGNCEVYIYFPRKYPPGAGIRVNGTLIKGGRHFAGEIGWLPLDIQWGPETADSFEACTTTAAKVVMCITAVLDPDSVVLYGEHFTEAHLEQIRIICRSRLPEQVLPEFSLSKDFTADFEQGLKYLTLNLLEG